MPITSYTLTVDTVGIAGRALVGEQVSIRVESPVLVKENGDIVVPDRHLIEITNVQGQCRFNLLPSSLVGTYRIALGRHDFLFNMPEENTTLFEVAEEGEVSLIVLAGGGGSGKPGPRGDPGPRGIPGAKGDPGEGVAAGGTTGQILTKKSNTDYDTEWQNAQQGGLATVATNATLTGDGSSGSPLSVANPFTIVEEAKLGTIETGAEVNDNAGEIVTKLEGLTGDDRLQASAIRDLPQPSDGGISSVETDSTLTGMGTSTSELSVANPFTDADETKLDGIESGAQVNVQSDWDATTGDAFIQNKPTLFSGAYADLSGKPTIPTVPARAGAFTAADETKLDSIETGATADQTATEIKDSLETLTGAGRLDASAIKNLPSGGSQGAPTGNVMWEPVGSAVSVVNTGTATGPLIADLDDLVAFHISYTRGVTQNMIHEMRKSDIPASFATPYHIHLQGSGTDHISIYSDGTNLIYVSTLNSLANITQNTVSVQHYNVKASGEKGDKGDAGTSVEANPSGTSGSNLTRISIDGTDYNIAASGDSNVQSDWDETDDTADSYIENKPTLFSGAYADLTGKPTIPTVPARAGAFTAADEAKLDGIETGAQVNPARAGAFTVADEEKLDGIETGAQVNPARAGAFTAADETKLDGIETGAQANVQSDWGATNGDSFIKNKPSLFSGAYSDLSGLPTLFDGAYSSLTGAPTIPTVPARAGAFTQAFQNKLTGIEAGATGDQTASEIIDKIESQTGDNRLDATKLRNLPSNTGGDLVQGELLNEYSWATTGPKRNTNAKYLTPQYLIFEGWIGGSTADKDYFTTSVKRDEIPASGSALTVGPFQHDTDRQADGVSVTLETTGNNAGRLTLSPLETGSNNGVVRVWSSTSPSAILRGQDGDGFTQTQVNKLAGLAQSDWDATSGGAEILNRPTLADVATSGDYDDLTNKPTIFSGAYSDLSGRPTLFSGSYNDLTNKPNIPTVPARAGAFTAADETKLDGIETGAQVNVGVEYSQAEKTKLAGIASGADVNDTAGEIVTKLEGLTGNARLNASAIRDLPQPSDGGIASVTTDSTLTGNGTSGSALGVANPFTAADETKLDGIAAGAEVNVQPDWNANSGDAAIANKPNLATVATSGRYNDLAGLPSLFSGAYSDLSGRPTLFDGDYNSLSNRPNIPTVPARAGAFTAADEAKLDAIEARAEVNNLPDAPGAASAAVKYELNVAADGTVSWTVASAGGGGGGPVRPVDAFLFGVSDDETPQSGELTIAADNGVAAIPVYSGSKHILFAREADQADITSIRVQNGQLNQIGAWTKFGSEVTVSGTAYNVWVSNRLVTNPTATTFEVS